MGPASLQGAVRSYQVHQIKQVADVGCDLSTLFNTTDITNSFAVPHFKATRQVRGELLKFNTANWLAFPLRYKVFDKYNISITKKRTLNCVLVMASTIYITKACHMIEIHSLTSLSVDMPRLACERKQIGLHLCPRKITSGHSRK